MAGPTEERQERGRSLGHAWPDPEGWQQYYGHFHGSALKSVWRRVNRSLIGWLMRKHKKLAGHKTRAAETLKRLAQRQPGALVRMSVFFPAQTRPAFCRAFCHNADDCPGSCPAARPANDGQKEIFLFAPRAATLDPDAKNSRSKGSERCKYRHEAQRRSSPRSSVHTNDRRCLSGCSSTTTM